ncbi:CHRD domain-containing protein [Sinobaca qinghaiensis]|uniref:CHRD domain-containing protein n=1 Tax=Sinobaca qinghaiensis TaxID=342944 RepID=A0A419UX53_9BACL|nr:CHRD domain-containing protein [Sinobaca qinghaiensis]RKD69709.1 CHRD domain-containing protein [Sinobaca qinghaiensis]
MKKRVVLPLTSIFAFTAFAGTAAADHEGREFMVELTPDEETMNVESDAMGQVHFEVSEDGDSLMYSIHAEHLDDAVAGHLHSGAEGEDGPVELFLFENDEPMNYDGEVASGMLTEDDLVGDMTWEEVSMGLVAGEIYANLHTEEYPDGELRGQLDQDAQDAAMMPEEMPQTGMGGTGNGDWMTAFWASITALAGGTAALFIRRKNQA